MISSWKVTFEPLQKKMGKVFKKSSLKETMARSCLMQLYSVFTGSDGLVLS